MEEPNLKMVKIGTKEQPRLKAKDCQVTGTDIIFVEKAKSNKAVLILKHPEKEEPIHVSSVAVMREKKDKKEIISLTMWVNLDSDKLLAKDSALAQCLKFYNKESLQEMVDVTVKTEIGSDGYLAIKAY